MLELKTKVICEKKDHLQMAKNAQIILTTNEIGVALLDDQSKLVNIPLNEPVLMSSFNVDEPEKVVKKTYKFICVSYSPIDPDRIACLNINGSLQIFNISNLETNKPNLKILYETKLERITSFKFNPSNNHSILLVHGSTGLNQISTWNLSDNTFLTREIVGDVFSIDWAADGQLLTATTYKNQIKILDCLLMEKISFEEKRREKAILLSKNILFHCGGLNNLYKYGLYEIDYKV